MIDRDMLFLLPGTIADHDRFEYCPECAEIWGVLSWFPALRAHLDIRYQPVAKPRPEMAEIIGPDHQNCPTLIIMGPCPAPLREELKTHGDYRFFDNARSIGRYFALRHGTPVPRGSDRAIGRHGNH